MISKTIQNQAQNKTNSFFVTSKPLSKREFEILILIKEGLSNPAIATKLDLSIKTIENHTRNIFIKHGAKNRTEAVVIAVKNKVVVI
jgi:DNA-binding NarL/FixJ family response regulator